MTTASAQIEQARAQLQAIAGQVLDQAARYRGLPTAPGEPTSAELIARVVGQGCADAQPYVQVLSAQLQSAAAAVRSAGDAPAFLALDPPGVHAYVPTSGKPLGWEP